MTEQEARIEATSDADIIPCARTRARAGLLAHRRDPRRDRDLRDRAAILVQLAQMASAAVERAELYRRIEP